MKRQIRQSSPDKWPQKLEVFSDLMTHAVLPDGNGGFRMCPELMTEEELIAFLRIPEVSDSDNYHNVVEHLKRARGLPRIHISNKALYPRRAIEQWIGRETAKEK